MAGLIAYSVVIGAAWKSIAVLGGAGLLTRWLRRRPAADRHLVWTGAFAALIALPLLSLSLPALRTPMSPKLFPEAPVFRTDAAASVGVAQSGRESMAERRPQIASRRADWRAILLLLWAAGAAVSLAQIVTASAVMIWVRRRAGRLNDPALSVLCDALGIKYEVALLEMGSGAMPMALGWWRPAVLLPADAAQWTEQRRRLVLLHELAHLSRGDIATNLLARLALCLYWWNPLAWAAWREFVKERERAADDLVLRTGARASEYAGHLLDIARTMSTPRHMRGAVVAMARTSDLEGRLAAILDSARRRGSASRAWAWLTVLLAVVIVAPLAALSGQDAQPPASAVGVDATIASASAQKNFDQLDQAARAAISTRQWAVAQKLLEASLSVRGGKSGIQSVDYGVGLTHLGDLERRQGQKAAAEWYAKAEAVLGNQPEAATALTYLGIAAIADKKYDQAMSYLQRAETASDSNRATAEPIVWMAIARDQQGMLDEADALYRKAIWQDHGYPNGPAATTDQELYASFLKRQHRETELAALTTQIEGEQRSLRERSAVSPSPGVYKIESGMKPPKVISKVEPGYSEEARVAKYEGTAVISVELGIDGRAHNLHVLRGLGLGLDDKALDAVDQWQFQPAVKDGQPVPVLATIEVNFRLL